MEEGANGSGRGGGSSGKNVLAGPSVPFISWAACRDGVFPPLSPLADQTGAEKSYSPPAAPSPPRGEKRRGRKSEWPRDAHHPAPAWGAPAQPQAPPGTQGWLEGWSVPPWRGQRCGMAGSKGEGQRWPPEHRPRPAVPAPPSCQTLQSRR